MLQLVGLVAHHARLQSIEGEHDGETDRRFGGGHGDDEESENLAVHVPGVLPVERHEHEIHGVQHELDAHELNQHVAPHQKADRAEREDHAAEQHVVLDHVADAVHHTCSFSRGRASSGRPASRGCSGPWNMPFMRFRGLCSGFDAPRERATAIAPTTATIKSAVVSSKGTTACVKICLPTSSTLPCSGRTGPKAVPARRVESTLTAPAMASAAINRPATMRDARALGNPGGTAVASGPSNMITNTNNTTTAP